MTAPQAASPRIAWLDVPAPVRAAVEQELGSPVASAVTQIGGFSPGAAVRVVCADGRRAFVKAVGADLNPDSPDLYRAEIVALHLVPEEVPHARLLATYDDGCWVALVLEDIEGYRPSIPWSAADATLMSRTLGVLARTTAPDVLPPFADVVTFLSAWDDVAADGSGISPELRDRAPELREAGEPAGALTSGHALVHWDARADNVIVRDGQAVLLDWAWAGRGAPWLDTLLLAMDFRVQGGPDPDAFLRTDPVTRDVPPEDLRAVLAAIVGMFIERARRPPPPGLPTIRAWQAHCRDRTLQWYDDGTLWN
jgi:hypothetical protein